MFHHFVHNGAKGQHETQVTMGSHHDSLATILEGSHLDAFLLFRVQKDVPLALLFTKQRSKRFRGILVGRTGRCFGGESVHDKLATEGSSILDFGPGIVSRFIAQSLSASGRFVATNLEDIVSSKIVRIEEYDGAGASAGILQNALALIDHAKVNHANFFAIACFNGNVTLVRAFMKEDSFRLLGRGECEGHGVVHCMGIRAQKGRGRGGGTIIVAPHEYLVQGTKERGVLTIGRLGFSFVVLVHEWNHGQAHDEHAGSRVGSTTRSIGGSRCVCRRSGRDHAKPIGAGLGGTTLLAFTLANFGKWFFFGHSEC